MAQQRRTKKQREESRKPDTLIASGGASVKASFVVTEDEFKEPERQRVNLLKYEWIHFLDRKYEFYKGLLELFNNSTTLRRCITDKRDMALGDGFIATQATSRILLGLGSDTDPVPEERLREIGDLIGNVNLLGEDLQEVISKCFLDRFLTGNVVVELVKTTNEEGQEVVYLYHTPLDKVAIRKPKEQEELELEYGLYDFWLTQQPTKTEVKVLNHYPRWTETEDGTERCVIHVKDYAPGFDFWGIPDWITARFWAELEYRIPKYNLSKFKNGFTPSAIVQFFGSVGKDEAQKIVKEFTDKFTDTGNDAKMFVQILRDERLKANVQTLEDKNQGNYLDLQQLASQAIVNACRYTMSLAGFATEGKLGTNQQIRLEAEYVMNMSIKPVQNQLLAQIINPWLQESLDEGSEIQLAISNSMPVSFMGDVDPADNLLTNEQREILGFEPLEDNQLDQLNVERRRGSLTIQSGTNE